MKNPIGRKWRVVTRNWFIEKGGKRRPPLKMKFEEAPLAILVALSLLRNS